MLKSNIILAKQEKSFTRKKAVQSTTRPPHPLQQVTSYFTENYPDGIPISEIAKIDLEKDFAVDSHPQNFEIIIRGITYQ